MNQRPRGLIGAWEYFRYESCYKPGKGYFVATLNALMADLGMVTGLRHCHDEEPEECAGQIVEYILNKFGKVKLGLIGI